MTAQNDRYEGESPIDQPLLRERRGNRRKNPLSFAAENSGAAKRAFSNGLESAKNGANDLGYTLERIAGVLTQVYWGALAVFVIEIVLTIMGINLWRIDWWGGLGKDSEFLHHGVMTAAALAWWFCSTVKVSINSFLKRWSLAQESIQDLGGRTGDPLGFNILMAGWRSIGGFAIWFFWTGAYFAIAAIAVYTVVSIVTLFGI